MAKSHRKAIFYCENCGELVPQNAKFCSKCGKFFTFVRCPNCAYTGDSKKFTNGCPECGYAVKPYGGLPGSKNKSNSNSKSSKSNKRPSSIFGRFGGGASRTTSRSYESSLPIWIYVVTLTVLLAVIFGIYSCL